MILLMILQLIVESVNYNQLFKIIIILNFIVKFMLIFDYSKFFIS